MTIFYMYAQSIFLYRLLAHLCGRLGNYMNDEKAFIIT